MVVNCMLLMQKVQCSACEYTCMTVHLCEQIDSEGLLNHVGNVGVMHSSVMQ